MATVNQMIAEQVKLLSDAQKNLEAAQKKPPAPSAAIEAKEALLVDIKESAANLDRLRAETIKRIDDQIGAYRTEITSLEKQIEEDKKTLRDEPTPPRPRGPRGSRRRPR